MKEEDGHAASESRKTAGTQDEGELQMGQVEQYQINLLRVYLLVWSVATTTSLKEPRAISRSISKWLQLMPQLQWTRQAI